MTPSEESERQSTALYDYERLDERPPPGRRREPRPDGPDDEYVTIPSATRSGPRLVAAAAVVLVLIALVAGGAVFWATQQIDPSGAPGPLIGSVTIPKGSSTDSIAGLLAQKGVISNETMFKYYAGWKDAGPWKAGEYTNFRTDMSFDEAIKVLDKGPVPPATKVVRVTEGERLVDALASISQQFPNVTTEQLQGALDSGQIHSKYKEAAGAASWEGFLFPDSYQFEESADAVKILSTMAKKNDDVLDELGYERSDALQGRSPYQLITTASLAEREAGTPADEKGKVARVIYNRLDSGEALGVDAALLYGLNRTSGELTKSDLETDSPYNTRTHKGLPPTPIASASKASLEAAINPPAGPWKYYVLVQKDPPAHLFTDSYKEFQAAKADAQKRGVF